MDLDTDVTFTLWFSKQRIGAHVWSSRLFPVYVRLTKQVDGG